MYENVAGGIGIAEKAFDVWREILEAGTAIAEKCSCADGCPRCICPPRRRGADQLSKHAGVQLAARLRQAASGGPTERFDPTTSGWDPL